MIAKKLCIIVILTIFVLSLCLIYSVSVNLEIQNSIENRINSYLIAVSQSITDIQTSKQLPNTSYAKENCIALLSTISQYQILNKKVSCFDFERLIQAYRHLLYTIDEKGLDTQQKEKLDCIHTYILSFQNDEKNKLDEKFLNFNQLFSADEQFLQVVRW